MKKNLFFAMLLSIVSGVSSCQAIGDIFKAGVWVGILGVVILVAIIAFVFSRKK